MSSLLPPSSSVNIHQKRRFPRAGRASSSAVFGAFGEAGDNSTPGGASYLATLGNDGWSAHPTESSAAEFQNPDPFANFYDATPELADVLTGRTPVGAKAIDSRLYIRGAGENDKLVEVGPALSPTRVAEWSIADEESHRVGTGVGYAGASPDLSHVFFTLGATTHAGEIELLWPGDGNFAGLSLYEYVGTGNHEPILVGVKPGPREAEDRPEQEPELISHCGTALGATNGAESGILLSRDSYNAISSETAVRGSPREVRPEEGATVFFTANRAGCPGETPTGEPRPVGTARG